MKRLLLALSYILLLSTISVHSQPKTPAKEPFNDTNTPLHLLQPDYQVPYGELTPEQVKSAMDRVLAYLAGCTPAQVIDQTTGKELTDLKDMDVNAVVKPGTFRLTSYEWGVTYAAVLAAAQATNDPAYEDYVSTRFDFLARLAPHYDQLIETHGSKVDARMRQVLRPHALDDAGAMCAAMIKAQQGGSSANLRPLIDNYMDFIMNKQFRLSDGTFARNRPQQSTLWLDDLFMSVPAIVNMGKLTGEVKYYDEAVRQIRQFSERMFIPEKGLYRHGWVESSSDHPAFCWARANGWAILTLTEVLDALPRDHAAYDQVLEQYRAHIRGITSLQSSEGFWHQLLDRNDSYLETSATAIFVYCIARGINQGWLDPIAYGPVAQLGWHAVSTKINDQGEVGGTCVGTGMGFDPAFYYYRPVNTYAAHGYGPVLWAGAEMINLLNRFFPRVNDSAVQYYRVKPQSNRPIFEVDNQGSSADAEFYQSK